MRRALPFHPILVAAFPVLFLWARNAGEVLTEEALPVLGVALAGGGVLFVLLWLVLRNGQRAALMASGLLLLFFSYGHVREVLGASPAGTGCWWRSGRCWPWRWGWPDCAWTAPCRG